MALRERVHRVRHSLRVNKKRAQRRAATHLPFLLVAFCIPLLPLLAPSASRPSHPQPPPPDTAARIDSPIPIPTTSISARHPLPHPHVLASQRLTNHSFHSVRALLPQRDRPPLHALFICQTACCIHSLSSALRAVTQQTFVPTFLTVIHACGNQSHSSLLHAIRNALADQQNHSTSYTLRPEVVTHFCPTATYATCTLAYLAHSAQRDTGFALLFDEGVILEPTALEKAYLSLIHRSNQTSAIRLLSYDPSSLQQSYKANDPLKVRTILPSNHSSSVQPILPVPLFYSVPAYQRAVTTSYHITTPSFSHWAPLISVLSQSRLLPRALYTRIHKHSTLSFDIFQQSSVLLPPHLHSELAFYKWSARRDESEMYQFDPLGLSLEISSINLAPIPFWPIHNSNPNHIMFILPWMQMGGSENAMLDIANHALSLQWNVTFVFTMPFWIQDSFGEIALQHQWIDRALRLTSDVFDLVQLVPHQYASRLLRHLLESRRPNYVLISNSRWAYSHSSFINAVLPSAIVADYNHMIHMSWEGGGLPRFGANQSRHFDLHLTASKDVENSMRKWIAPNILNSDHNKVQTCYIGTDPDLLYSGAQRTATRSEMRALHGVSEYSTVVLYAGRFIIEKGIDIVADIANVSLSDDVLRSRLTFVFVGSGPELTRLQSLPKNDKEGHPLVIIQPPAAGLQQMRKYYAMSDVFLLPSINEGIALVLYEAIASGMLAMSTDVGGQRELVTDQTGVLLTNFRSYSKMKNHTLDKLRDVLRHPEKYANVIENGTRIVRERFTTEKFCECVMSNLQRVRRQKDKELLAIKENLDEEHAVEKRVEDVAETVLEGVVVERYHGMYNRDHVERSIEGLVTIGIKTFVCDASIPKQVEYMVRSIRVNYPRVRVILANDGPKSLSNEQFLKDDPFIEEHLLPADSGISYGRNYMVNLTNTRYFVLLDDDHVFDDTTNLTLLVNAMRKESYDIVGLRVRNLPGIDELERIGIIIPRYVANVTNLRNRELTLCVWNENEGPSIFGITHPIPVHVLHNAFIADVDVLREHGWRNELKVNEHMTFFLDAKDANLKVGYLPSVFVHHRAREYSDCYFDIRFREDKYADLLPYKEQFVWDLECQRKFPERVRQHIIEKELAD
ncbi:Beta-1,4 N-acetylgalactosaminyltransferase 1 [Gracilariopsis chorda]|uniref:Beta-1,4 N-acetylgalactosaminyltransferase 1 n=1 Tax=Gracilariopsis chorda TaxID=448386 RepID=A0A2V3J1T6_9FLOR|nr:Beta-1,4 N-acetylgalactosaminyltransferase 1 [Gracilariopsis chorda]|eukprot:PXF48401.1 Beta-1,4 N-acetylgalactosaminyltransferase 1 [Gracilariopsis chorda]